MCIELIHAFLMALAKRSIPYEYREISPRRHDWRIWNEEIPVFMDKLDALDGFQPIGNEEDRKAPKTRPS